MASPVQRLTSYAAFHRQDGSSPQIGHLDHEQRTIQPLAFLSGTRVENLYQVIEAGADNIVASSEPAIPVEHVKILPPISGRDVLAVGKNYMEHAKEFNSSGYDSSDKVDRPSHPVIFTKRATSIIADGEDIFLHEGFTQSADYEGEIGVIVGKAGFKIKEEDAWAYVWGYTIINDITARERQRDHKQFYIGKSPDTFCPMGPCAVPKEDLPNALRVQTRVNGELRQNATTEDLIFSIPHLISTLSAGTTLQPGDVLATGTPAGVGIGRNPPVFLQPGDEVVVSIDGIGSLKNRVAASSASNMTTDRVSASSAFQLANASRTINGTAGLTTINSKRLNYERIGSGKQHIVFVHGLGSTKDFWAPLISTLELTETSSAHVFDFEGHGLSPTHPLGRISIDSLVADLAGVFDVAGVSSTAPATLVGHSMGAVIAAEFALAHPSLVNKLVLVGAPQSPLPAPTVNTLLSNASVVRRHGMSALIDQHVTAAISEHSKKTSPLVAAAVRLSLLNQDPEGYAKAATALASHNEPLDLEKLDVETLIVSGQEDVISPPALGEEYARRISRSRHVVLHNVGHLHVFEDAAAVAKSLRGFW
ncbi:Uncharacterized protein C8034_v010234 [Colletotrichum sidae]|uniref:Fumarylacetoacetate hydrolase domain-containing protein 2 n=1 Tax=Colletotrichum sidae TaxID=1347389 RepID=A0A4R8TLI9_9PEZI|nr:Uncharacterized protein C8034_v010234 [Colletotrichum sidae]